MRGGNTSKTKQTDLLILLKPIRPKILHCAFECVTLCWSASEGLSPQLGKEASLLPSNTIHTLLTLPPVLSFPVHSHPDTPSPPTTSLHGWLMSGVTINACLLLAPTNATDWASSLFASSGSWGSGHQMRHYQKITTPEEEVIAGRAQCINTLICSLYFITVTRYITSLENIAQTHTYFEGIISLW